VDDAGDLLETAHRAWNAGLIMDIGHGAGSFSFANAERLLAAGLRPDVISSDLHQLSIHGPLFDLPTCLSKFLALGLTLPEVIRAATSRPAEVMGRSGEIGTLKPGALADVALFRLHEGRFTFYDTHLHAREGKHLLRNTLTIVNGKLLPHIPDAPPASGIRLSDGQQALIARGHTPAAFAALSTPTEGT
jgi:dihydroorotase